MSKNIAIIFAGGSGVRMGSGLPKQFLEVNGKPIIIHTLDIFEDHPLVDEIYISCKDEYIKKLEKMVDRFWIKKVVKIVAGGETGQDSIYNALAAAKENNEDDAIVLIHDGVRPFIPAKLIDDIVESVKSKGSAITCTPLTETPVLSGNGECIEEIPDRNRCFTAQAPQSFYLGDVLAAHNETRKKNPGYKGIVDSCALMKSVGKNVFIVKGNRGNIKVTTPEDLYVFRAMIQYKESQDVFGFSSGEIPTEKVTVKG